MAMTSSRGASTRSTRLEKTMSSARLSTRAISGTWPQCRGNGRKLADVFDGAVPGQAVIHVGNHAQIDAVRPRFLEHILHDAALAGRGEEDLVDKLLAGMRKEGVEVADDISGSGCKSRGCTEEIDEAFEGIAEVANALHMVAQSVGLRTGAHDEDIAGTHASFKATVEQNPINQAAQAEGNNHQAQRNDDDSARDVVEVNEVQSSREQKKRGEAGLNGKPLLMEITAEAGRPIEVQALADDDQRDDEPTQQAQEDSHGAAVNQGSVPKAPRSGDRGLVEFIERGENRGTQNSDCIQGHPEFGSATCITRRTPTPHRHPFGRGDRCGESLPEI